MTLRRLPAVAGLSGTILATRWDRRHTVADSERFLLKRRRELSCFDSLEEFVTAEGPARIANHEACERHLLAVRGVFAKELWARDLYLGVSLLDELVFWSFAHGASTAPVREMLTFLRDRRFHTPGVIIFPLHSVGLREAGIGQWLARTRIRFVLPQQGIAVLPQSNSYKLALRELATTLDELGVRKRLPKELMDHWIRSRPMRWLERNHLLVVRVQTYPGVYYYDNQFLVLRKLQAETGFLALFADLLTNAKDAERTVWSTARINNWETRDVYHYLSLYGTSHGRELDGDCVPSMSRSAFADLMELPVDLPPGLGADALEVAERAHRAVRLVHAAVVRHIVGGAQDWRDRTWRKLFEGLGYYRRSLRSSVGDWQSVVALATAFEYLLTDNYGSGISGRLRDAVSALLSQDADAARFADAVAHLYEARCEIVHGGLKDVDVDLRLARIAFARCYIELVPRVARLRKATNTPITRVVRR